MSICTQWEKKIEKKRVSHLRNIVVLAAIILLGLLLCHLLPANFQLSFRCLDPEPTDRHATQNLSLSVFYFVYLPVPSSVGRYNVGIELVYLLVSSYRQVQSLFIYLSLSRTPCLKCVLAYLTQLIYSEIKHSDWLIKSCDLQHSNHSDLFQCTQSTYAMMNFV